MGDTWKNATLLGTVQYTMTGSSQSGFVYTAQLEGNDWLCSVGEWSGVRKPTSRYFVALPTLDKSEPCAIFAPCRSLVGRNGFPREQVPRYRPSLMALQHPRVGVGFED